MGWKVNKRLFLHSHICFEGAKTSYEINTLGAAVKRIVMTQLEEAIKKGDTEQEKLLQEILDKLNAAPSLDTFSHKPLLLFNCGAHYKLGKVTLSLDVHNLFNSYYERSGMGTGVVPQKGRWFNFEISYKF